MDYLLSLRDEKLDEEIMQNAPTTPTGLNVTLKHICGMNRSTRDQFMREVDSRGYAEIIAAPDDQHPYSIFATNVTVLHKDDGLASEHAITTLRRRLDVNPINL